MPTNFPSSSGGPEEARGSKRLAHRPSGRSSAHVDILFIQFIQFIICPLSKRHSCTGFMHHVGAQRPPLDQRQLLRLGSWQARKLASEQWQACCSWWLLSLVLLMLAKEACTVQLTAKGAAARLNKTRATRSLSIGGQASVSFFLSLSLSLFIFRRKFKSQLEKSGCRKWRNGLLLNICKQTRGYCEGQKAGPLGTHSTELQTVCDARTVHSAQRAHTTLAQCSALHWTNSCSVCLATVSVSILLLPFGFLLLGDSITTLDKEHDFPSPNHRTHTHKRR